MERADNLDMFNLNHRNLLNKQFKIWMILNWRDLKFKF